MSARLILLQRWIQQHSLLTLLSIYFFLLTFFFPLLYLFFGKLNAPVDLQKDSLEAAVYFSIVTGTTVGYGDVLPDDNTTRVIAVVQGMSLPVLLAFGLTWITGEDE